VSILKSYPGHARKVMHAIWGLGQAMFSKCIAVVDEDVNVQDVQRSCRSTFLAEMRRMVSPRMCMRHRLDPYPAIQLLARLLRRTQIGGS
jgi:hypothetical protein